MVFRILQFVDQATKRDTPVSRRGTGEYVNPSRDEMLLENAERLDKRLKQQEVEESGGRRPLPTDRAERVRRSGVRPATGQRR